MIDRFFCRRSTWAVGSTLWASTGVHGGQFTIQDEAEPTIAAIGKLQSSCITPDIKAVPASDDGPVFPVVRLPLLDLFGILLWFIILENKTDWLISKQILNSDKKMLFSHQHILFRYTKTTIKKKMWNELSLTFSGLASSSFSSSDVGPARVDTLLMTPSLASWSKNTSPPLSTRSLMICSASRWPSSSSCEKQVERSVRLNFNYYISEKITRRERLKYPTSWSSTVAVISTSTVGKLCPASESHTSLSRTSEL